MRSEAEMLDLILGFARQDDNIRAVFLNGSRANPNAPRDRFQDFDIACLVRTVAPYVRNPSIPPAFGEPMIVQTPEDMGDPPPAGGGPGRGHYAYLMQFMDGNRIDLSFYPFELKDKLLDDSLTVVLLDKDAQFGDLPPAGDRDYLPKPPTPIQFADCCNEFWWMCPYMAKGLWRGEVTYAHEMLNLYLRPQLMKMLTWYFGLRTGFQKAPGKTGKYMRAGLEPETWQRLEQTYSDASFEHAWQALFTMGELFREVGRAVGGAFGYAYPEREDAAVSEYLRRIHASSVGEGA